MINAIIHTGADFKKCMVIGDYFHASNFGVFDSKAGEMLACVGCDSDSKDACLLKNLHFYCLPSSAIHRMESSSSSGMSIV